MRCDDTRPVQLVLLNANMQDEEQRPIIQAMPQFAPMPWIALVDGQPRTIDRALRAGAFGTIPPDESATRLLRLVEAALHGQPVPDDNENDSPKNGRKADPVDETLKRRLVEQQTLSMLARSLSSVLDVDALLTQIVEAAVSLTNAEEGLLLLPDEEEQALYIRAHKGIDSETASNFASRRPTRSPVRCCTPRADPRRRSGLAEDQDGVSRPVAAIRAPDQQGQDDRRAGRQQHQDGPAVHRA